MLRWAIIPPNIGMALTAIVAAALAAVLGLAGLYVNRSSRSPESQVHAPRLRASSNDPRLVYSDNPNDSWNRIFHSLFTRKFKARVSDAFAEHGPFISLRDGMARIRVSTRTFPRFENGDRAIEPLYPSFFNEEGVLRVLTEPDYSALKNALDDALKESRSRSSVGRALMQSDVWAAYDILFAKKVFSKRQHQVLSQRRKVLLSLLGRFTLKLALTPAEIQTLPDNYARASANNKLPSIFAPDGEWIEIQISPHRLHDFAADFRRCARVFLRPEDNSIGKRAVLERLRSGNFLALADSFVLVMQNLLIDAKRNVVPIHLTTDVQIRKFIKGPSGEVIRTEVHQYELSRQSLLRNPGDGGLMEIVENAGVYLPVAGNDYLFASPQFNQQGTDYPVLVSLSQRCEGCHGRGATGIFTFSTHNPFPLPPITQLPQLANVRGWYVAGRKQEREDFKALLHQR
jgi:hypothetical protein